VWKQVIKEFQERIVERPENSNVASGSASVVWHHPQRFTGAEAVEILTTFLTEKRESLGLKEVTVEKATKFCEILLRDNTIAAAPENKNTKRFEASRNAFYYFSDTANSSLLGADNIDKENLRRYVTPKSCRSVTLRSSTLSLSSVEDLGDLDEKIVRDFALSRLLTIVDIPVLEGILHIRTENESGSMLKTLENLFGGIKLSLRRNSQSPDTSGIDDESPVENHDRWTSTAYHCLQLCHSNTDIPTPLSRDILYRIVVNAYKTQTSKRGPLIPSHYNNILVEISLLISTAKQDDESKALEACQCLCLLLPKEGRDQLGAVLEFLSVIREEEEPRLQSKMSNVELVMAANTFSKFILSKDVQDDDRLMEFFIKHAKDILICPKDFREQVYYRQTVLLHTFKEPKPEIAYCDRITTEEYNRQALTATNQALFDALSNVVEDKRMSDHEKFEWFETFRVQYPDIYEARFPSMTN